MGDIHTGFSTNDFTRIKHTRESHQTAQRLLLLKPCNPQKVRGKNKTSVVVVVVVVFFLLLVFQWLSKVFQMHYCPCIR